MASHRLPLLLSCAIAASLALLPVACGGDSSSSSTAASAAARERASIPGPLVGEDDPVLSTRPSPKADPVTTTSLEPVRARPPQFGTDNDEASTSAAKPLDPCTLVSRATVQRIAGKVAARSRGRQGPTCIYTLRRRKADLVTVAVLPMPLPTATRSRHTIRLKVGGRTAYCVNRGSVTLLVPVPGGRVLSVGAPCPTAARIAAAALPRLGR